MRIEIACFTENGEALARRIADLLSANATRLGRGMSPGVCEESFSANVTRLGRGVSLSAWTEVAFAKADALVFVGAAGIAVRAVAPLLVSKAVDPGVLVVDETGSYVIPILSGHIGGANELARRIARELSAEAVVTTATDRRGVFAADAWAARHGTVVLQPERIKKISANLLSGGEILWESDFSMEGDIPPGVQVVSPVKTPKDVQIFLSEESSARKRESVDNEPLPPPKGEVARRSRDGEGLPRVFRKRKSSKPSRRHLPRQMCFRRHLRIFLVSIKKRARKDCSKLRRLWDICPSFLRRRSFGRFRETFRGRHLSRKPWELTTCVSGARFSVRVEVTCSCQRRRMGG